MASKSVLLLVICAILFSSVAWGQESFSVSINAINDSIFLDGQAILEITIVNEKSSPEQFRISVPDVEWSAQSDPLYHYFSGVDVPGHGSATVTLLLKPTVAFTPGLRYVNIGVQSVGGRQRQEFSTFVNIRSANRLFQEYLAAVSRIVEIPSQIDPRQEFTVKVNLVNRNPRNISQLKVILTSVSTSLIRQEIQTNLEPLESKAVTARIKLDPRTPPVKDTLRVVLFVDDKGLEPTIFEKFEIISYSEIKPVSSEKTSRFFRTINKTIYANEGNVHGRKVVEHRTNFFRSFFTTSRPDGYSISRAGQRFSAWELSLEPGQQASVEVVESYRSLFYLLAIALLSVLVYRFFQSPVQVLKEANAITYKEGGISELKVILRIKNRSSQPYIRLTLMDRIPMIAEVEHDSMGTMKPATVFNDGRGSVVKWELESLDRHEERIVAYKIRSRLSILGQFRLPKASLRFYSEKNVKFLTHSNTVTIKP